MTDTARQVATIEGSPCVNCHEAPCRCFVDVIDRRGTKDRTTLRRYRFPDGAIFRLDDTSGARALAAGAVLCEQEPE